jgi:hypothetical protein
MFAIIPTKTANISFNGGNRAPFHAKTYCVSCEVRNESLYIMQMNVSIQRAQGRLTTAKICGRNSRVIVKLPMWPHDKRHFQDTCNVLLIASDMAPTTQCERPCACQRNMPPLFHNRHSRQTLTAVKIIQTSCRLIYSYRRFGRPSCLCIVRNYPQGDISEFTRRN